ncbi:MAG: hypothetical protein U1A77_20955 [Pirellulales bacterium]
MGKVRAYPTELTNAVWQKKKSVTAGKTGIGEELKKLVELYDSIQWKLFEDLETIVSKKQYDTKFPLAQAELEKVEKFKRFCGEFESLAEKQAATMKAVTNKGTKKLLEEMAKLAKELGAELLEFCESSLDQVANSRVIAEYPQRLKAWIERKNNLLKVFKKAKGEFDEYLKTAKKLAAQSDELAKNIPSDPESAKRVLKALAENAVSVNEIHKTMKSEFAEYFKLFEPHRSNAEKADTHQLEQSDLDDYKGVFTEADNLRKELEELMKLVESVFQETIASAKEAQATTLKGANQAAAYLKVATDLAKTYGDIGAKVKGSFIAKSILGDKSVAYRDSWMGGFFRGIEAEKDKEKQAELIRLGKIRAQQRRDQVDELETQLKRIYESAEQAINKIIKGIPEESQVGEIAEKIELVRKSLKQVEDYLNQWVEENAAAHKTYDEAMNKVDELLKG